MMHPLIQIARALRSILSRSPPRFWCATNKDQGATGDNPYVGPLATRNRNRFRLHCLPCSFHSQFPAATGRVMKAQTAQRTCQKHRSMQRIAVRFWRNCRRCTSAHGWKQQQSCHLIPLDFNGCRSCIGKNTRAIPAMRLETM